jgi:outer membrane protein
VPAFSGIFRNKPDGGSRRQLPTNTIMKTLKTFAIGALLVVVTLSAAAQTSRIAIVDMQKVFDDYYKTKAADAAVKERAASLDKERNALLGQYQKATDEYKKALEDANDQAVSAEEREKRKKTAEGRLLDIKSLEQSMNDFQKTAQTSLDEQIRRMHDNIIVEIRKVIDTKAKTGGFSLVFDVSAESRSKVPVVLYFNGENDLTTNVLAQLNTTAPAPNAKPAEGKSK